MAMRLSSAYLPKVVGLKLMCATFIVGRLPQAVKQVAFAPGRLSAYSQR